MNTINWILQATLAVALLSAGLLLSRPMVSLAPLVGGWVGGVPLPLVRSVALIEVAGGFALIVPTAAAVRPLLISFAAAGLVLVVGSLAATHARHRGTRMMRVAKDALIEALAASGRCGAYSFPHAWTRTDPIGRSK
jgi:hypothetical protein